MKCCIQWIDAQGNPTPDDNDAIGYAVMTSRGTYPSGASADKVQRWPICAEHLDRMPTHKLTCWTTPDASSQWSFEPLEETES